MIRSTGKASGYRQMLKDMRDSLKWVRGMAKELIIT